MPPRVTPLNDSTRLSETGQDTAPRILVVDDNADAATSLGRLLNLSGFEVRLAHDGVTALTEVEDFQPRIVLMDLGMPGMDGLETADRIRQLTGGQQISMIAVTGWGQDEDRQRTQAAGFAAHLVKPIRIAQLEAVISGIVEADRARKQKRD